jgi:hypothetical protein
MLCIFVYAKADVVDGFPLAHVVHRLAVEFRSGVNAEAGY